MKKPPRSEASSMLFTDCFFKNQNETFYMTFNVNRFLKVSVSIKKNALFL
jgi:hypothetical protein